MASAPAAMPASSLAASLSGFERMMITAGVMLATVMQILDTTIANVALPHMQTALGATAETVTWVLTSYIVAVAVAIPITGWLADRIGRRNLYLASVAAFTAASALCALATNLPEMVAFRIMQGVSGAFLMPLAQSVLFDINPPEKHARAMSIFGAGVVIGPILGPVIGGWLTENFNWRWVFIVNVPVGVLCMLMLLRFMPRTDTVRRKFDLLGFALLAISLAALQMMMDRGQQRDWFDSWEIWIELALAVSCFWMFLIHLLSTDNPLFEPRIFADSNFSMGVLFTVVTGLIMYGGLALLPTLLQRLLGHTVLQSGFLTAPRGIGTFLAMILSARLGTKLDPRLSMFVGSVMLAFSLWLMSGFDLVMDSRLVITSGVIQGLGVGLTWMPVTMLAFATLDPKLRTSASSILSLTRSLGGSLGISMVTSILARNIQVSHADLGAQITSSSMPPLDPSILGAFGSSGEMVTAMLDGEINRQAAMIAYIDDFHLMMWITLATIPLILLLRKPKVRSKDMHVVME